jgi:pyruvate formate lyase activating enzyme
MRIGGIQRLSLIDYPGRIASVIFTAGCNFRCPYCHNPELVTAGTRAPASTAPVHDTDSVLSFLHGRRNRLDGVVLSGGEPTLQHDLPAFAREVRSMGYVLKLDTNGSRPGVIQDLIDRRLLDYLAMDVKAPPGKYDLCTGTEVDLQAIQRSISLIVSSGVEYQFRTTVARPFLRFQDLIAISLFIGDGRAPTLQACRTDTPLLDRTLMKHPQYSDSDIARFRLKMEKMQRCGAKWAKPPS